MSILRIGRPRRSRRLRHLWRGSSGCGCPCTISCAAGAGSGNIRSAGCPAERTVPPGGECIASACPAKGCLFCRPHEAGHRSGQRPLLDAAVDRHRREFLPARCGTDSDAAPFRQSACRRRIRVGTVTAGPAAAAADRSRASGKHARIYRKSSGRPGGTAALRQ